MLGTYCIPTMVSALFSASGGASSQEFTHSKSKLRAAYPKDAEMMQCVSAEDMNNMWTAEQCHKVSVAAAAHLVTCTSLIPVGSRCSTHSNQMVSADSPISTPPQQQQPPCKRCRIECSGCEASAPGADAAAAEPSTSEASTGSAQDVLPSASCESSFAATSSSSSSGSSSTSSSSLAYDEDFVFEVYYGDPSSEANRKQQRPKQTSPFAAFASLPSYDL